MALHLVKQEGERVVLDKEDIESIETVMGYHLIGRFLGRFSGLKALK